MEISTCWLEKFWFLCSNYSQLNYTFCYFFLFRFSSHVTRKSSQEKSSYRLWNQELEFLMIIWLVIYHMKAYTLWNSKICILLKFDHYGRSYDHFTLWVVKMTIFDKNHNKCSCYVWLASAWTQYLNKINLDGKFCS